MERESREQDARPADFRVGHPDSAAGGQDPMSPCVAEMTGVALPPELEGLDDLVIERLREFLGDDDEPSDQRILDALSLAIDAVENDLLYHRRLRELSSPNSLAS